MSEKQIPEKKAMGRPRVDAEPLTVRLPPRLMTAVDDARRDIATIPSRPDIVRLALAEWLKLKGYLK